MITKEVFYMSGFKLFDAIKDDAKKQLKEKYGEDIEKIQNDIVTNKEKRIWFEPKKKDGTSQNILNYFRQQQNKDFEV